MIILLVAVSIFLTFIALSIGFLVMIHQITKGDIMEDVNV